MEKVGGDRDLVRITNIHVAPETNIHVAPKVSLVLKVVVSGVVASRLTMLNS
jgi:hypothetical protein